LYRIESVLNLTTNWVLNDLFIDELYRKQGVGTVLLHTVQDFVSAVEPKRAKWIQLATDRPNVTAQAFYSKNNW
jgi:GNAT superfamily N-acetyltransferase